MYQYFTQTNVLKIIMVFILAQILGSALAVGFVEILPKISKYPDAGFEILRGGPSILLIIWFFYDFHKKGYSLINEYKEIRNHIGLKDFFSILAFNLLIGLFSVYAIIFAVVNFLPADQLGSMTQSNGLMGQTTLVGAIIGGIVAVFLAPLAEEFIFRGFLFTKFQVMFSVWTSMIFSSLLFGAIHFSISSITTFLFGLSMCIVFYKTKNLAIPILLHTLNNAFVSIISIYSKLFVSSSSEEISLNEVSQQFYTIALPCFVVSMVLAYYLIKKRFFLQLDKPFIIK